jgi:methanogenic corrinoid protein MtbC1
VASDERTAEILKGLHDTVVEYDEEKTVEIANIAVEEGVDAFQAIMSGLAKGMETVGELYARQEYFVPELLLCADALYAGLEVLRPHLKADGHAVARKIILGVVEGDIHDIGKNLVKVMFDAAGWEVFDLGADVKIERFAEEQKRTGAQVVGISALMTTSMLAMPRIIKMLRDADTNVRVLVGGAPLNPDIAASYGADGYADNAGEAVEQAVKLLQAA